MLLLEEHDLETNVVTRTWDITETGDAQDPAREPADGCCLLVLERDEPLTEPLDSATIPPFLPGPPPVDPEADPADAGA
jgi:hypothetical protein